MDDAAGLDDAKIGMPRLAVMRTDAITLIREAIKVTMRTSGVSEAALAAGTFIPRSTLSRKLAGASEFTLSELLRVSDVLGVEPAELIRAGVRAA